MTTIYDRYGKPVPTITAADLKRLPGRFWKLAEGRGAVSISQDGYVVAVGLSLDQFVSLLFGIQRHPHRMKRKNRQTVRAR